MNRPPQSWAQTYMQRIVRWRWLIIVVSLVLAGIAAYGVRYLQFTSDFRVYFGPKNPELIAFTAFENTYTKTDNILFVLQPREGDIFSRDNLAMVARLTEEAWQIPSAIRVDSITNFQHTEAVGDDLVVADLVENPETLSDAELERARDIALNEPALLNRLISPDGRTTGVVVTLQFPSNDHSVHLPAAVERAMDLAADLRQSRPDVRVALTGLAVMSYTEVEVSRRELETLAPVMDVLIILAMLILLRSASGTLASVLVVTLATASAVGISAWLGMKMQATSAAAPIIILTVAIADSVHILLTAFHEMGHGRSKFDALAESLRVNTEPVFLTSLTTGIGFLSLNFSDAPPLHDLGNISAMGVFAAWVLSMTFLPAMVSILPVRVRRRDPRRRLPMERFGDFVVSRRKPLLFGMTALTLVALAFIPRMQLDDRFVEWFDESLQFRQDTDFAAENLIGPYTLEFSIGAGGSGGISEPAYLARLEAFGDWLQAKPEVTHVASIVDIMKRINKSMHGDDPAWYRLPDRRDLAAQYLLLYEMSLPYGLDLNSQISVDKSASRVTATLTDLTAARMRELADEARDWLRANTPPAMWAEATGPSIMFANLTERNLRSMFVGTAIAFLLIALVLVIALRSVRLGLVSLFSNFTPVIMMFGLWAAFVGEIGVIAAAIAATSLGLIVDDTVHILSKYNRAHREHGLGAHDGIRYAFSHVGTALWVTTVILVAGFAVLTFSDFRFTTRLGLLTAVTLTLALIVDFLMLPPLLMLIDKQKVCSCATCRCAVPATELKS